MKKILLCGIAGLFLTGCMTMNYGIGKKEIDPQLIAKITINKTTKPEILEWFGNPHSISTTATGQEVYKYVYMKTESKTTPIPIFTTVDVNTQYQELNVMFKSDIVIDYTSTRR